MKKILIGILLFSTILSTAQEDNSIPKKHELRFNAFSFIVSKNIDFTYEYLLDEKYSTGISLLARYGNNRPSYFFDYHSQDYAFTPYFRYSFMNVDGFSMAGEIFTMLHSGKYVRYLFYDGNEYKDYSDFALGFGLVMKYVSPKGFLLELNGGLGRNLSSKNNNEIVVRSGMSFGYRF